MRALIYLLIIFVTSCETSVVEEKLDFSKVYPVKNYYKKFNFNKEAKFYLFSKKYIMDNLIFTTGKAYLQTDTYETTAYPFEYISFRGYLTKVQTVMTFTPYFSNRGLDGESKIDVTTDGDDDGPLSISAEEFMNQEELMAFFYKNKRNYFLFKGIFYPYQHWNGYYYEDKIDTSTIYLTAIVEPTDKNYKTYLKMAKDSYMDFL